MLDLRSQTPKGQRARTQILRASEQLFSAHGFHGASMRDLAKAARLPLATVVYHFARKERLYAAVLETIASDLMAGLAGASDAHGFVTALVRWTRTKPERVVLLLRELLDNPPRITRAAQFPLAPFLLRAAELVGGDAPELAVLHVVGGTSYVVAAWPTVARIVGKPRARALEADLETEAVAFARRALGLGEPREPRPAATARSSRARAPRAQDHRRGVGTDAGSRRGVRRRGPARARAQPAVPRLSARGRSRRPARRAG
ncbi:MAG: TetR family transcriptional regulator [Kofleriaceae bacterium]